MVGFDGRARSPSEPFWKMDRSESGPYLDLGIYEMCSSVTRRSKCHSATETEHLQDRITYPLIFPIFPVDGPVEWEEY